MRARGRQGKPASRLLTVGQVATLLNVHPNTVRRWERLGLLRAFRVGPRGDRRFDRADVDGLLRSDSGV